MEYFCDLCEQVSDYSTPPKRIGWLTGFDGRLCFHCFSEWYDGVQDVDLIRVRSLRARGIELIPVGTPNQPQSLENEVIAAYATTYPGNSISGEMEALCRVLEKRLAELKK